ncbi:MAG TPA: mechanosensitive ion channel family protein, partial [Actinomycetota bacterium]|nr:mechanosensitive ion channel family protein [Actinomycetota bacterium]
MQLDRYRRARPHLWRAAIAALVTIAALTAAGTYGQIRKVRGDQVVADTELLIAIAGAGVVLLAGFAAVRAVAAAIRAAVEDERESTKREPLALLVSVVGYVLVLFAVLGALDVPVGKVLLGGALTGVIVGIAAQQSLGNFFAGIILLIIRPFHVGEQVVLKSGPLGGEYEGVITEMSMFYVH